jgi:hypothetical protein
MATITTTEFAEMLETTPRNLRKFLRADLANREIATPGKGSRYAIEKREVKSLTRRFHAWQEAQLAKKSESDSDNEESE